MPGGASARDRIILAAVGILEKEGTAGITTRRIAADAGVNLAAVNYYFGSKEQLLDTILAATLTHGFADWRRILGDARLKVPERIFAVFTVMLEGIERNPGVVAAHMFEKGVRERSRPEFTRLFGEFLDEMAAAMGGISDRGPDALRMALGETAMAVMAGGLMPELIPGVAGGRLREEFVADLMRRLLGTGVSSGGKVRLVLEEMRERSFDERGPAAGC